MAVTRRPFRVIFSHFPFVRILPPPPPPPAALGPAWRGGSGVPGAAEASISGIPVKVKKIDRWTAVLYSVRTRTLHCREFPFLLSLILIHRVCYCTINQSISATSLRVAVSCYNRADYKALCSFLRKGRKGMLQCSNLRSPSAFAWDPFLFSLILLMSFSNLRRGLT